MKATHLIILRDIADGHYGLELWDEPKRLIVDILEAAVHLADAQMVIDADDASTAEHNDAPAAFSDHMDELIAAVKAAREKIPEDAFS